MSTKPQDLGDFISKLRQTIVGKVAFPTNQIEQITLFLFLKQLSVKHDELVRLGAKKGLIFVDDWEDSHFDKLMQLSGDNLVEGCKKAIESLYLNPNIDKVVRAVFERSYLQILDPEVLAKFLDKLSTKFDSSMDLGDFYESLLPAMGHQNDLGQFRTPRHIIDFVVEVVNPKIGEKILDPACGTAGFLIGAFNYLKKNNSNSDGELKLNSDQIRVLFNESIFGWDMEPLMVKFALANLYLHEMKVLNVTENDTLVSKELWDKTFDVIVANPPFITPDGGAARHEHFTIASNKTEVLFLEFMLHSVNIDGRFGVVVPEGIVFDTSAGHVELRKRLIESGLWAVVSLPVGVFNPYSGKKTNILFLDKSIQTDKVLFYEIKNHGFSLTTNPSPILENDLPEASATLKKYLDILKSGKVQKLSGDRINFVDKKVIKANKTHNLTGSFYNTKSRSTSKYPIKLLKDIAIIGAGNSAPQDPLLFQNGTHPFFRTSDVGAVHITTNLIHSRDYLNDKGIERLKLFPAKTILFPKSGASTFLNHRAMLGRPGYVVSHLATIQAKENIIYPEFLFYILTRIDARSITNDQDYPSLNLSQLGSISIPVPTLEEQKVILDKIHIYKMDNYNLTEKIEENQSHIELTIDSLF